MSLLPLRVFILYSLLYDLNERQKINTESQAFKAFLQTPN